MSGFDLDPSRFYSIYHADALDGKVQVNLAATSLFDNDTMGSVLMTPPSEAGENARGLKWQFFPVGPSFVLRSPNSGPTAYLSAYFKPELPIESGQTAPKMMNASLLTAEEVAAGEGNSSIFWNLGKWDDGTLYFSNRRNGSNLHLSMRTYQHASGNVIIESGSVEAPQHEQRYTYEVGESITDARFSKLYLPGASEPLTPTTSRTQSFSASLRSLPSQNPTTKTIKDTTEEQSGLSKQAQIGAGVGIGLVALLVTILAVLFLLWRRRKLQKKGDGISELASDDEFQKQSKSWLAPDYSEVEANRSYHEVEGGPTATELPAENECLAELPGKWWFTVAR